MAVSAFPQEESRIALYLVQNIPFFARHADRQRAGSENHALHVLSIFRRRLKDASCTRHGRSNDILRIRSVKDDRRGAVYDSVDAFDRLVVCIGGFDNGDDHPGDFTGVGRRLFNDLVDLGLRACAK